MNDQTRPSAESDDEPTAAADSNPLESLRDRDGVRFTEETDVLDRETFETVREDSEVGDGAAIVGVTNDDGEVLLKDTCTGWLPPGGNVESGEDWAAVAREQAESWTGAPVELDGVERVRRIDRRLEGADPDETPDLPFHVVYFRASLATVSPTVGETVAGDSDDGTDRSDESKDDDAPEVEWFDGVPEGVDSSHEDDVRVFLD